MQQTDRQIIKKPGKGVFFLLEASLTNGWQFWRLRGSRFSCFVPNFYRDHFIYNPWNVGNFWTCLDYNVHGIIWLMKVKHEYFGPFDNFCPWETSARSLYASIDRLKTTKARVVCVQVFKNILLTFIVSKSVSAESSTRDLFA